VKDPKKQAHILELIQAKGGLRDGVAAEVAKEAGVAEADVFGAGSFFHLLSEPDTKVRVCTGLSCMVGGAGEVLAKAQEVGLPVSACSCLAACDRPPAVLRDRDVFVEVTTEDMERAGKDWRLVSSKACPDTDWRGVVGPESAADDSLAMHLAREPDYSGAAFARALELGADQVIDMIDAGGLQGRGGAGFPAAIKWRGVRSQPASPHYIVLNADEGEPATFKDRDVMLRRPDLVLEGLAIAARTLGADEVYLYLRGEFTAPKRAMKNALDQFEKRGLFEGVTFHFHDGHGAYICGEETALLEALEGKRGMPRLKPPFPTENGLWGKPTLIQNVETIACVPSIVTRGGEWFKALGRTEAGSKLYSISGHVARPGTYELALGVTLDELVEPAGGSVGELRAFSPGGASSGLLPAGKRELALDFRTLADAGSMLGSAGVVVLNDTVDIAWAVRQQLEFFEIESCGQCAPCRIGTRFLREAMDKFQGLRQSGGKGGRRHLEQVAEVSWEMNEGSICGLGQAASLPLTSALEHFPEEFSDG
jgi:NADH:ubiquinone oxidoreductase subunit F (NADH-binding)/NADH:ubiquinone oxidoreductase subunit E